ncbi:MAG: TetR/AcrR family transcriptional regulator [Burkholderiales bacterium]
MTRSRADDYDDKKQSILQQAAALFALNGFDGTSMRAVALACGSSKSHLYHYFPHKEDLLFGVVSGYISSLAAELQEASELPLPAEERFGRFIDAFVQHAVTSRHEQLVLTHELKYLPEPQRATIRELQVRLVTLMVGLLKQINPGLMAPEQVRGPYAMLMFGMLIWMLTWYQQSGPIAPAELAQRISQLLMGGFKSAQFPPPAGPAGARPSR